MCMMVYLAADLPLRTVEWNKEAPAFNTSPLAADDDRVRGQFEKSNITYAGSYEGCGCGFQLGKYPGSSEPAEVEAQRKSLREFAAYLRGELPRVGSIQLFASWDGDQQDPPEHRRVLTPSALENDDFFFLEKELSIVTEDAAPEGGVLSAGRSRAGT
jgi:hypothetical protein